MPFYHLYERSISFIQPEIEKARKIDTAYLIIDAINQANSYMSNLFSTQNTLTKLLEEASSANYHWLNAIDSAKQIDSVTASAKIVLDAHFNSMALASLLAQECLIKTSWNDLGKSAIYKSNNMLRAIESFNCLTTYYKNLVQSFNEKEFKITNYPPFISGLPPIEILMGSKLLDAISADDTEKHVEESETIEFEIGKNIESSLEDLLNQFNPNIRNLWLGAKEAFSSNNPDRKRHIIVSLREMITHILHTIAPDTDIYKWTKDSNHYKEGKPTREARILYICRNINHDPFTKFLSKDIESHIEFIRLFQRGTHEINVSLTEIQLKTLIIRAEALARFLLVIKKGDGSI